VINLITLVVILLQNSAKVKPKLHYCAKNYFSETNKMEIGNRIKELRLYKGLSYDDFAMVCGVSVRSQRMYESNNTAPTAEYCKEIAEKFTDIDMNWLLTGEGEMLKAKKVKNEEFSDEDIQILRMLKRLPEPQKKKEIADIEVFLQSVDEAVSHWVANNQGRHQATMA
jgi:transcriptional regulator with XRE-family HTH domain